MDRPATPELVAGPAHPKLATAVAESLGISPLPHRLSRTDDGEVLVRIDESAARGRPIAIVQPIASPVGDSLLELLLLADACRRADAGQVTAAVPYLGYLRQDRRAHPGEPLGSRVVADLMATAQFHRILVVDPHTAGMETAFSCPVEMLSAVPLLARALRDVRRGTSVVVAPDLGATKLAQRYARRLELPVAIVHKERLGPADVRAERIVGDVAGRSPIIVDDMISTGATIAGAAELLVAQGAKPEIVVVATHGLFAGSAFDRLRSLPLTTVITTDTVAQPATAPFAHEVIGVAPLLAEAIRRASAGESAPEQVQETE
jgi:ribose-phosphate pyrophosphokinase